MNGELNFDATKVMPAGEFGIIPAGQYPVSIVKAEWKTANSNENHKYINIEYKIISNALIDDKYKDRRVFEKLHLVNSNKQAVKIAQESLSSICRSIGRMQIANAAELLQGDPLKIKIVVKNSERWGERNEVSAHYPLSGKMDTTVLTPQSSAVSNNGSAAEEEPANDPAPVQPQATAEDKPWLS